MLMKNPTAAGYWLGVAIAVVLIAWWHYGPGALCPAFIAICAYCWGRGERGRYLAPLAAAGSACAGYIATAHYGNGTGWIMAGFMIAFCWIISLLATTFRYHPTSTVVLDV